MKWTYIQELKECKEGKAEVKRSCPSPLQAGAEGWGSGVDDKYPRTSRMTKEALNPVFVALDLHYNL